MTVFHKLKPLFRGLAAANKPVEATTARLAEIFPLCWTLEKDFGAADREGEKECTSVIDSTHDAQDDREYGTMCRTPEELSVVLRRVYQVRYQGMEAQPVSANTKNQPDCKLSQMLR